MYAQLLDTAPPLTVHTHKGSPGDIDEESDTAFQRFGILHQTEPNEYARASKRLCLPGLPTGSTNNGLFHLLVGNVSAILQSDCGKTMADLRTSIQ